MTDMTRKDFETLSAIADRALTLYAQIPEIRDKKIDVCMDIENAHDQIPLNLEQLLTFDEGNFAHDIFGIRRHMDRGTATLGDCFVPRCAFGSSYPNTHK